MLFGFHDRTEKCVHCKYLPLSPYKPLEKFSKALYGTKGGTYSARIFRPVMHPYTPGKPIFPILSRNRVHKPTAKEHSDENFV